MADNEKDLVAAESVTSLTGVSVVICGLPITKLPRRSILLFQKTDSPVSVDDGIEGEPIPP